MGNCCTLLKRRNRRRHIVLILIGLDNAGKTQTVNTLTGDKDDKILPTVGFKAVNLIYKDTPVTIYDLGGSPQFRQIWPQYYSEVHGIIFVIDSSDFSRLEECKAVLEEVLSHDKISGKPVLILANKQDKQGALDDIDVVEKLNIEPLVNKYRCPTLVESYTANTNSNKAKLDPGLKAGYQWLLNYIVKRYGDINLRVQTDIHAELERRRCLANKNLVSQTVTELSDDQTGFENPNYESPNRNSIKADSVIKPIPPNNSLNTTVTLETNSNGSSRKPKLSPLFGTVSDHGSTGSRVELEARNNFRKLSPIVKKPVHHQEIEFQERPQSCSSLKKHKIIHVASKDSSVQEDNIKDVFVDGDTAAWEEANTRHKFNQTFDKTFLFHSQREILREGAHRSTLSAVTLGGKMAAGADAEAAAAHGDAGRPASASQLVCRQLELAHGHHHKRRFSFKYGQRRKTSPWRAGGAGPELEGGDCARATRLALQHRSDLSM